MSNRVDPFREEYTIDTPENVTFGYEVVGIGSRFIGALIDSLILGTLLFLLNLIFIAALSIIGWWQDGSMFSDDPASGSAEWWAGGILIALYFLLNFALFWGYFILFELLWRGQTPGKRVAKIRVVDMEGNPAGFTAIAVRNLVRLIDFFPAGYGLGLVVMFCNRRARRLGDFAAGTLVIREQGAVSLETLAAPPPQPALIAPAVQQLLAAAPMLRRLTADDYGLIVELLARHTQGNAGSHLIMRGAAAIALKIGVAPPAPNEVESIHFLKNVLAAYPLTQQQSHSANSPPAQAGK
jgi:uncharacterized RDD family membrane protein YckC